MNLYFPSLNRKPCWLPSALKYLPTMSPDGVIAVACVLTAPGKSNEVKSDFELGADEAPDVCAGATEVRNTYPNKAMSRKSLGIARNPPQDAASEPYFYFRNSKSASMSRVRRPCHSILSWARH